MKALINGQYIEVADRVPTPEEIREQKLAEIEELKAELANTDYKAIKFAEGWLTDDEYATIKAERQALRDRINQLEREVSDE